jgi:RNA polymerase primary sigma factor
VTRKRPDDDRKHPGRGAGGRTSRGTRSGIDETVAELSGPLERVLRRLPETQRKVLELRMGLADGHPHDLADTARSLGLSLSEARDIEKRAFDHIREAIPLQQLQRFLER